MALKKIAKVKLFFGKFFCKKYIKKKGRGLLYKHLRATVGGVAIIIFCYPYITPIGLKKINTTSIT